MGPRDGRTVKEDALARALIEASSLPEGEATAKKLRNWRPSNHKNAGDLVGIAELELQQSSYTHLRVATRQRSSQHESTLTTDHDVHTTFHSQIREYSSRVTVRFRLLSSHHDTPPPPACDAAATPSPGISTCEAQARSHRHTMKTRAGMARISMHVGI